MSFIRFAVGILFVGWAGASGFAATAPGEGRGAKEGSRIAGDPSESGAALPGGASQDWWSRVRREIAAEEYAVVAAGAGSPTTFHAVNRANGFSVLFAGRGASLTPSRPEAEASSPPSWRWGLELVAWGRPGALLEAPSAEPEVEGNRVEYLRGDLTEWFVNDERGVEQGFTIPAPPTSAGGEVREPGVVHLDLALSGTLNPSFSDDGQAVDFFDDGNIGVLHYASLKVTDATGRTLPAHFEGFSGSFAAEGKGTPGGIRIVIDDSGAIYPITVDPLATSPAWSAVGEAASNWFAASVATAGDVNGDGFSDAVVGAVGNGSFTGKAYLYLGGPSGLATSSSWSAVGEAPNNYFGRAVVTAGDVNGDGYADVVVGADGFSTNTGKAYLYLGGPSGLSASASWSAVGEATGNSFGWSLAPAGDVDGDGYSDLVVGAHGNAGSVGKAYLYRGGPTGLLGASSWTAVGEAASDAFGHSVATAGDVNGDGYSDVVIGADNQNGGTGKAYLFLGGPSGLGGTSSWSAVGEGSNDWFGGPVATAGDVNGDGYSDVVVGALRYGSFAGKAYLYLGGPSGLWPTSSWTATGEAISNFFGSVATAGDVNGDGYADVLVGANGNSGSTGKAYLYLGGPSGLPATSAWTAVGEGPSNQLGARAVAAGDVNGDGYSDVVVGASGYATNTGKAYLYLGGASGLRTTSSWAIAGETTYSTFGGSVSSAGDVNGDGYDDVIVGAYEYNSQRGKAYLFLGSASGLSVTPSWTATGEGAGSIFASSAATAGDINGDGYGDVVVGAFGHGSYRGKAYLYLGGSSGLSWAPSWTDEGDAADSWFGHSVATAGDVNGDGYGDVVVGAAGDGAHTGKAYLYLGGPTGLSSLPSWTAVGQTTDSYFGWSVASAGDVNRDGYSDVLVGASGLTTNTGKVDLYSGSASGLGPTPSWTVAGSVVGDFFGDSVASAGDVNGDGYSDIAFGAPVYSHAAYLYLGGPSGPSATASWTASEPGSQEFGGSVATAGDVNGDGFSDLVVGAAYYSDGMGSARGKANLYLGAPSGLAPTASWSAIGQATSYNLGWSVASAGDVNGDGFSDVVVGAWGANSLTGKAYMYFGGGGPGVPMKLQQVRADLSVPIAPLGLALGQQFRMELLLRTPYGTAPVKLQWQALPLGASFVSAFNPVQSDSLWLGSGTTGVLQQKLVPLPDPPGPYKWRARVRYHPAASPFQSYSRWFTPAANGRNESDLRSQPQVSCVLPDEPCWIYMAFENNSATTLSFQDPNQSNQRTGWNIRRSNDPAPPKSSWPLVGTNVVDMEPATPNYQWTDGSGDDPAPGATWYYEVTAYNANCPAEGPF